MIKNIIFDLGGVILNIDYNKTAIAFQKLGLSNFTQQYSQALQSKLFDDLEIGAIEPTEFRKQIRFISGLPINDSEIDLAWNAMLLDLPKKRIDLLRKVRKNYKIFLLSNTNKIHLDSYTENLQKVHSIAGLQDLFDKEYFSHLIHLRKPNKDIFEFVLGDQKLKREETLFIDDSLQHVEGAKKCGIHAIHLNIQNGMEISKLFDQNGKLLT